MRVCAIAAAIVLAMDPSVLVGVSFQMSFGAVVALIAVYETYGTRLGRLLHGRSLSGKVLGYCGGVVVTTVVVTLGTYPYSISLVSGKAEGGTAKSGGWLGSGQ